MDSATKNLENDHVHILRLIDVMELFTNLSKPDISDLETIVSLIKNYADGFHHQKEEKLLFPMLAEKGFSPEQGPVAVMLHEHAVGRNFVKGMSEALAIYKDGDENAIPGIVLNMRGYISLLRNHIAKENNILFRMADNVLTPDDHQALLKEFSKVEKSTVCGGVLADCIRAIEKLEESFVRSNA
jgi:hemerythrin-like domain-containing protein